MNKNISFYVFTLPHTVRRFCSRRLHTAPHANTGPGAPTQHGPPSPGPGHIPEKTAQRAPRPHPRGVPSHTHDTLSPSATRYMRPHTIILSACHGTYSCTVAQGHCVRALLSCPSSRAYVYSAAAAIQALPNVLVKTTWSSRRGAHPSTLAKAGCLSRGRGRW